MGETECSGVETSIMKDGEDRTGKACVMRRRNVKELGNYNN